MPRAESTFTVDSSDQQPLDDREGAKLARARLTKTFRGDVVGTSTTDILTAQAEEGSAAYVGIERLHVSVHGRAGSFVLVHEGWAERGDQTGRWRVLPDSGTDALRGLRGEGEVVRHPDGSHDFTLDYELPA